MGCHFEASADQKEVEMKVARNFSKVNWRYGGTSLLGNRQDARARAISMVHQIKLYEVCGRIRGHTKAIRTNAMKRQTNDVALDISHREREAQHNS